MKISLPKRRLKLLGIAQDDSAYDFPFAHDTGNRFLFLLIALMTYLAILAGGAGLTLTGMANRWTNGVSGHLTIEIPAFDSANVPISSSLLEEKAQKIVTALTKEPTVSNATIRPPKDVAKLVEPWLGASDLLLGQVPLPLLINIQLSDQSEDSFRKVEKLISRLAPQARIETHQSWLADVLRLTGTLSFTAYLIGFMTLLTTIFAVAGAVRARMAAYHEELEILHLIGAQDEYIVRQFQRHAFLLSCRAAAIGFLMAVVTFIMIDILSGSVSFSLTPALIFPGKSFLFLICVPVLACIMTIVTARLTVLQVLRSMT